MVNIPQELLRKWRRITLAKLAAMEPTTMRALELILKEQWSTRLSQLLIPYSEEMPAVKLILTMGDPMRELCKRFG